MMKSCSITKAVFFAWRMNLDSLSDDCHAGDDRTEHLPLDDFAGDDTLLGVQEPVTRVKRGRPCRQLDDLR